MSVKITPESGPVGTPIKVRGQGHRLAFALQFLGAALRQPFHRLDVGGDHRRLGDLHDSGDRHAGRHIIEVVHGEFTFPYRNPQQNPEPGRPRWTLAFNITPGAPVLPPPPEQQAQTVVHSLPAQGDLVSTPPPTI